MQVEFWVIIDRYCDMELVKFGRRAYHYGCNPNDTKSMSALEWLG